MLRAPGAVSRLHRSTPASGEADEIIAHFEASRISEVVRDYPYLPNGEGQWLPSAYPTACIEAKADDRPCRLRLDHLRGRKTGPCFPIAVVECVTHHVRFTLYPSGHIPYGRDRVAPVAPDGQVLRVPAPVGHAQGDDCAAGIASGVIALWQETRYAAIADAACGKAWRRASPGPYWSLQLDRLDELAELLTLASRASDSDKQRGQASRTLGIPELSLRDSAKTYLRSKGFRARGQHLLGELAKIPPTGSLLERVLAAGAAAGLWGTVHFWSGPPVHKGVPSRRLLPGLGLPDG